jgi:hypothetical protein
MTLQTDQPDAIGWNLQDGTFKIEMEQGWGRTKEEEEMEM